MATAARYDYEEDSQSDSSDESDSDENSDEDSDTQAEPCRYYNKGGCKNGNSCAYMHVCKYALKGNCRNGSRCKLNHKVGSRASSGAGSRSDDRSTPNDRKLTDGRYYQWQLNSGSSWKDIENDHIIEAQYSLPHTKSIKIYNTQYGAVSIDFNRMTVRGKSLRVRRLDDGKTTWLWYCMLGRKWISYGTKDSKGNSSPVKSSDIEKKFQSDRTSSFTFNIGAENFEIKFREMRQVSKRKRKVTRRPQFRQQQQSGSQIVRGLQNLTLGSKPKWQFEGKGGTWYDFRQRTGTQTECSVTSDDIETKYQQNQSGTMKFAVNGQSYRLDFGAMTQTNLKNMRTRQIRRV